MTTITLKNPAAARLKIEATKASFGTKPPERVDTVFEKRPASKAQPQSIAPRGSDLAFEVRARRNEIASDVDPFVAPEHRGAGFKTTDRAKIARLLIDAFAATPTEPEETHRLRATIAMVNAAPMAPPALAYAALGEASRDPAAAREDAEVARRASLALRKALDGFRLVRFGSALSKALEVVEAREPTP